MPLEEGLPRRPGLLSLKLLARPYEGDSRFGQRVTIPRLGDEEGRPRVSKEISGVLGQRGHQKDGIAVVQPVGDEGAIGVPLLLSGQGAERPGAQSLGEGARSLCVTGSGQVGIVEQLLVSMGASGRVVSSCHGNEGALHRHGGQGQSDSASNPEPAGGLVTESEQVFVNKAVSRGTLFLRLSVVGVGVGLCLSAYYLYLWWLPEAEGGSRSLTGLVIVVLILLNARQNLRQYRYAGVLKKLLPGPSGLPEEPSP